MEEVVYNPLLLDQICSHISSIRSLKRLSRVCKLWQNCCDRELARRVNSRTHPSTHHLFYLHRLEDTYEADPSISYEDKRFVLTNFDAIRDKLVQFYREEMQIMPKMVVMFNAKMSRSQTWAESLQLDCYRKYMPKSCRFIHIDSATIIGTSLDNDMTPFPAEEELAGISHLLMDDIEGMDVNVYYDKQIFELLKPDPKIKCVLYFESSKDFDKRDNAGHYMWNKCSNHMWDVIKKMKYELAFGGTRVNAIDFTDGLKRSEASKPFAVITIGGESVRAASIEFRTGSADSTVKILTAFKSRLGFDVDDNTESETIAFTFCRIIPYRFARYCHFKAGEPSQLIHNLFPKVRFIGTINVMNFGHDYWPGIKFKSDEDSNYRTTHFDSTILVVVNIAKKRVI